MSLFAVIAVEQQLSWQNVTALLILVAGQVAILYVLSRST